MALESSKVTIAGGTKVKLTSTNTVPTTGTTDLKLPSGYANVGNEIGDGITYGNVASTQAIRFLESSNANTSVVSVFSTPTGIRYYNFFENAQIPLDSTVTGVEVIAGPDYDNDPGFSRMGTPGSGASTDTTSVDVEVRLHNGVTYSSPLTYNFTDNTYLNLSGETGLTFSNSNTKATFIGRSVAYPNTDSNNDVIFGSTLAGLDWDPANQSDFGLVFTITNGDISFIYMRGIGLKVSYGYPITNHNKITLK